MPPIHEHETKRRQLNPKFRATVTYSGIIRRVTASGDAVERSVVALVVQFMLFGVALLGVLAVLLLFAKLLPVPTAVTLTVGCYGGKALAYLFGLAIVAYSKPLAPISGMSILAQRASWLGRYAVATIVVVVGAVVGLDVQSQFEYASSHPGSSNPIEALLTNIVVPALWLGFWIASLTLFVDLWRLGKARRAAALARMLRRTKPHHRIWRRATIRVGTTLTSWYCTFFAFYMVPLLIALLFTSPALL
jgi:hypothetical protein